MNCRHCGTRQEVGSTNKDQLDQDITKEDSSDSAEKKGGA